MRLYSLAIIKDNKILAYHQHTQKLFTDNVKEIYQFFQLEIAKVTPANSFLSIRHEDYMAVCYTKDYLSCTCLVDEEYPRRQILQLMSQVHDDPTLGNLKKLYKEYKTPPKDRLNQINEELAEVKQILMDSIDKVLTRGETIETIIEKTEYLTDQSKSFLIKSKKTNRCCVIL